MTDLLFTRTRLSKSEAKELYERMKAGDREAANDLAQSVIPWAIYCASRYLPEGSPDVDEVALCAVYSTLQRWHPEKGMLTTLIPAHVRSEAQKLTSVINPTISKLPRGLLQDSNHKYANKLKEMYAYSIDAVRYSDGTEASGHGSVVCPFAGDPREVMAAEEEIQRQRWQYRKMLESMPWRLRQVWRLRREYGFTLDRVGGVLSLTRERIRQLEGKAIERFESIPLPACPPTHEIPHQLPIGVWVPSIYATMCLQKLCCLLQEARQDSSILADIDVATIVIDIEGLRRGRARKQRIRMLEEFLRALLLHHRPSRAYRVKHPRRIQRFYTRWPTLAMILRDATTAMSLDEIVSLSGMPRRQVVSLLNNFIDVATQRDDDRLWSLTKEAKQYHV